MFHFRLLHLYVSRSVLVRFFLCFASHRKKYRCQCSTSTSIQRARNLFLYGVYTHTHNLSAMLLDMLSKRVCGSMFDEIEKHTHAHTHTNCILIVSMYIVQWYDLHGVVVIAILLPSHLFTYIRTKPCNVNYLCYTYSV